MSRERERGFTTAELITATALSAIVLFAVFGTTDLVGSALNSNERAYDATNAVQNGARHLTRLLQPARASSAQVRTVAGGTWTIPVTSTLYAGIQVQDPAAFTTEIEFQMDAGETDNDLDDDGDGLVDEGRIHVTFPGGTALDATLLEDVEVCTFALDGRLLQISLQCGRRDKHGTIHRVQRAVNIHLRNT